MLQQWSILIRFAAYSCLACRQYQKSLYWYSKMKTSSIVHSCFACLQCQTKLALALKVEEIIDISCFWRFSAQKLHIVNTQVDIVITKKQMLFLPPNLLLSCKLSQSWQLLLWTLSCVKILNRISGKSQIWGWLQTKIGLWIFCFVTETLNCFTADDEINDVPLTTLLPAKLAEW